MSLSKELVDYKCLEEELQQAVRDDELYQLKNDAKIRAVEQRVPTYDQFREMVIKNYFFKVHIIYKM